MLHRECKFFLGLQHPYLQKMRAIHSSVTTDSVGGHLPADHAGLSKSIIGIICGMKCLHGQGIVHRSLTLRNVFVHSENCPKITDSWMSRFEDLGIIKPWVLSPAQKVPELDA
jgi:serine/threonine protein kinase